MLQPIRDIDEYARMKKTLRKTFDAERTGDQQLFVEQSKLFKPLIEPLLATQVPAIMPAADERALSLRSLGVEATPRQRLPSAPETALSQEEPLIKIDLDSDLNETDIRNLQDMRFDLPSVVFKNKQIEETLNKIKTENRSIGQKLGKGSDAAEREKEIYRSWKDTLKTYKQKIQGLEGAKQFVGDGVDVIFYPSVDDLCLKLAEFDAAKQAGNTGLDNRIISVLDELLRTQAISKTVYDDLYKIIFL